MLLWLVRGHRSRESYFSFTCGMLMMIVVAVLMVCGSGNVRCVVGGTGS